MQFRTLVHRHGAPSRRRFTRSARALALSNCAALICATACWPTNQLALRPGVLDFEEEHTTQIQPGIRVNLATGNLLHELVLIDTDTRVMPHFELRLVYNSANASAMVAPIDLSFDGETFVDLTGAEIDTSGVPDGAPIPGTRWKMWSRSGRLLRSFGGMIFTFQNQGGRLSRIHRDGDPETALELVEMGPDLEIRQCVDGSSCEPVYQVTRDASLRVTEVSDWYRRVLGSNYYEPEEGQFYPATYEDDPRRVELVWQAGRIAEARTAFDVQHALAGTHYLHGGQGGRLTRITEHVDVGRVLTTTMGYYTSGKLSQVHRIGDAATGDSIVGFAYGVTDDVPWAKVVDPLGHASDFRFDWSGRMRSMRNAVGELTTLQWDEQHRRTRRVGRNGEVTTWSYPDGNTVVETTPSGNVITTTYTDAGINLDRDLFDRAVLHREDALGPIEELTYDPSTLRVTSRTDGAGGVVTRIYGPDGEVTEDYGPLEVTLSHLSREGHWQKVGSSWQTFDGAGNLVRGSAAELPEQPGRPGSGRVHHDHGRNPSSFERIGLGAFGLPAKGTVSVSYDARGNRASISRPLGSAASWHYDALGRLASRCELVDGEEFCDTFEHDPAGNPVAFERANGMRTEVDYDRVNRRRAIRHLRCGAGGCELESEADLEYAGGNLVSISDSAYPGGAPLQVAYDAASRPVQVAYPFGEILSLGYDARDRTVSRTYTLPAPLGGASRTFDFEYDGRDRPWRVLEGAEPLYAVERDSLDMVEEERFGNGLVRTWQWDHLHRHPVYTETVPTGSSQPIEETVYAYREGCDGLPWICREAEGSFVLPAAPGAIGDDDDFALATGDGSVGYWFGRQAVRGDGVRYRNDSLGNVLTDGESWSEAFNAERNRLLTRAGVDYEYDASGFTTRRGDATLTWSAAGRLASVSNVCLAPAQCPATFIWATTGEPISSTTGGATTLHLFGGRVAYTGAAARLELTNLVSLDLLGSEETLYRHLDFRGNVWFVTGESGDIVAVNHYGLYGDGGTLWGDGDADDRGFAQGTELGDSGLLMLGERVYDTVAMRFLSPDPVYHLLGQHAYTHGNPVDFWDPDGRRTSMSTLAIANGEAAVEIGAAILAIGGVLTATGNPLGPSLLVAGLGAIILGSFLQVAGKTSEDSGSKIASIGIGSCAPTALTRPREASPWILLFLLVVTLSSAAAFLSRRQELS